MKPSREAINTTQVTRGSAALRTLVTWVVLIASRDGFMEFYTSLTLFYTKMSFKILKFSNTPSFFFPSNLLF
jgi:hypothetical protein